MPWFDIVSWFLRSRIVWMLIVRVENKQGVLFFRKTRERMRFDETIPQLENIKSRLDESFEANRGADTRRLAFPAIREAEEICQSFNIPHPPNRIDLPRGERMGEREIWLEFVQSLLSCAREYDLEKARQIYLNRSPGDEG